MQTRDAYVVAAAQRQMHSLEGRALAAEQAVAALQQDVGNWQGRVKKKDAELASQTAKVAPLHSHAIQSTSSEQGFIFLASNHGQDSREC